MKVCCPAFKEFLEDVDDKDYGEHVIFKFNMDADPQFILSFHKYSSNFRSHTWRYITFCPFCGKEIEY